MSVNKGGHSDEILERRTAPESKQQVEQDSFSPTCVEVEAHDDLTLLLAVAKI